MSSTPITEEEKEDEEVAKDLVVKHEGGYSIVPATQIQQSNAVVMNMQQDCDHMTYCQFGTMLTGNKMYTPAHNMVVNPQNPNAPPIPICGGCQKETRDVDELVLCESGCNFWYHRECAGLTDEAFKLIKNEIFAEWVCDHCLAVKSVPPVKMKS